MAQINSNIGKNTAQQITQQQLDKVKQTSESIDTDDISKQVAELQEADLQQKIAKGISDAAAEANKQLNSMLSDMLKPIYDIIQQFKEIPPKIRSIVDVDGAANGMYAQMGKMQASLKKLESNMVSSEVPITLDDYYAAPAQYENLMAIEYQKNELTEQDCIDSGYTKIKWEMSEEYMTKLMDQFPAPQDRDIVGQSMEKAIGSAIKSAWSMVQPPINTIAGIANIGPIPGMIQSIVDAVDAIVQIASKTIPEEKLDEMLAQKTLAQEKAQAEAEKSKEPDKGALASIGDRLAKAKSTAANAISQSYNGVAAGITESFANFETPTIPDDIKETIEDFKDAIIMVKDNISNIYIIILLKMMGAVFKCFNQIIGVIGVPSIPDPLGKIPQILTDAVNVMQFIMGLPMSLVQCLIAIMKRKMKAVMIAMTPAPPLPIPEKIPIPPTSIDVVKPQITWDNIKILLTDEYKFSVSDADEIISKLQEFYDGSNEEVQLIYGVDSPISSVKPGKFDDLPIFSGSDKRFKMTPLYCQNTWIPKNLNRFDDIGVGYSYSLCPPVMISDTEYKGKFHRWTNDGDIKLDHDSDWSLLKRFDSKMIPLTDE